MRVTLEVLCTVSYPLQFEKFLFYLYFQVLTQQKLLQVTKARKGWKRQVNHIKLLFLFVWTVKNKQSYMNLTCGSSCWPTGGEQRPLKLPDEGQAFGGKDHLYLPNANQLPFASSFLSYFFPASQPPPCHPSCLSFW